MDLSMTKEKSDTLMKTGIIEVTSNIASDPTNFVRKLNKAGTKFERLDSAWNKFDGPRTCGYGQN